MKKVFKNLTALTIVAVATINLASCAKPELRAEAASVDRTKIEKPGEQAVDRTKIEKPGDQGGD